MDETGKFLVPTEVSHYPEKNGNAKTELKDQTEPGEKLVFTLQKTSF